MDEDEMNPTGDAGAHIGHDEPQAPMVMGHYDGQFGHPAAPRGTAQKTGEHRDTRAPRTRYGGMKRG